MQDTTKVRDSQTLRIIKDLTRQQHHKQRSKLSVSLQSYKNRTIMDHCSHLLGVPLVFFLGVPLEVVVCRTV